MMLMREGEGALPGGYIYHVAIKLPSMWLSVRL